MPWLGRFQLSLPFRSQSKRTWTSTDKPCHGAVSRIATFANPVGSGRDSSHPSFLMQHSGLLQDSTVCSDGSYVIRQPEEMSLMSLDMIDGSAFQDVRSGSLMASLEIP